MYVQELCNSKLSFVPSTKKYYTPYSIGKLIATHETVKFGSKRVTPKSLIRYLEDSGTVPVRRSSLYRLAKMYKTDLLIPSITWTETTTVGRKPYLSSVGFEELVEDIQSKTSGGIVMPISRVRALVKQRIYKDWKNNGNDITIPKLSMGVLHSYATRILSQNVFNIHGKIPTKTETRSTAEWSHRSTISFAMSVAVTHFLPNVTPTVFHRRKKDLCDKSKELWDMVEIEYSKIYRKPTTVIPVLPNLITSTDKTTMFVTSGVINNQEKIHITNKPTVVKNENVSSGCRNNYTTNLSGDSHCRGLRIVLNNTFTAGGLTAPIFVVVHGLSLDEMPNNKIVTIPVPNLVVGSNRDIYSDEDGYITFVRGSDAEVHDCLEIQPENVVSKDARLAQLYRELVYYPFIFKVRQSQYQHEDDDDIADNLQVVSWMDGAHAQLKLLTDEENLKKEHKLKITICKHSAARTGVEQAADCGPNFKILKRLMKILDDPHPESNPIVVYLNDIFSKLAIGENGNDDIVRLKSHKRKALIATIPNLPVATGDAFTTDNVKLGFIYNGQIDSTHNSVPCYDNLIHTFRGDVEETCLDDKKNIIENFFGEMLLNGCISEATYDLNNVPKDVNSINNVIEKPDTISLENRHRAKILSSKMQIRERRSLIDAKRIKCFQTEKQVYESEQKVIICNSKFESKLVKMIQQWASLNSDQPHDLQPGEGSPEIGYHDVSQLITREFIELNKHNMKINELQSFVKVRGQRSLRGGKLTFIDIPKGKEKLLIRFFESKEKAITDPIATLIPTFPVLLEPSIHTFNV